MMKFYIIIFFFISTEIISQSVVGVVNNSLGTPMVANANISFLHYPLGTITNSEGAFSISVEGIEDTDSLKVSHIGYETFKISVADAIAQSPLEIQLKPIGYNLPTVVIGGIDGKTVVNRMLARIKDNFPNKKHVLKGFYTEHTEDGSGNVLGYGETSVNVYKEGYKNDIIYRDVKDWKYKDEFVTIKKGFYESFYHLYTDENGHQFRMPAITEGAAIGKNIDVLKSILTFLINSRIKFYDFEITGITYADDEEAYVVKFTPNSDRQPFQGELVINMHDYALLSATYITTDIGNSSYSQTNQFLNLLSREYKVNYLKQKGLYALVDAAVENVFQHKYTGDTILNKLHFTTTERRLSNLPHYRNEEKLKVNESMEERLNAGFSWNKETTVLRPVKIEKLINDRIINGKNKGWKGPKAVPFIKKGFQEVAEKATQENKLIFIDVYTEWCKPCKKMDITTFKDTAIIKQLSQNFIPQKVDWDRNGSHPLIKQLKVRTFPSTIITDAYENVYFYEMGYLNSDDLLPVLATLSRCIDLKKVDSIYLNSSLSKNEKEILAAKEIYGMMHDQPFKEKYGFACKYMGKEKTWKEDDKIDFLYNYLIPEGPEKSEQFFLKNLDIFRDRYGYKEVEKKLYSLAFSKASRREGNKIELNKFVIKYFPQSSDSILTRIKID